MQVLIERLVGLVPVDPLIWRSFWDGLRAKSVPREQIAAVLAAATANDQPAETLRGFLASFESPAAPSPRPVAGAVNVVGTGGGPSTFNLSTASALVAAACGVPVIKTGSRAYSSVRGSVDMLEQLGITLSTSADDAIERLDRVGVAFAGQHAYPAEMTLLARRMAPESLKPYGRFLNIVGPLMANVPVTAQLTGVSDVALLPTLRDVVSSVPGREVWLVSNDIGVDELIGFANNDLHIDGTWAGTISPGDLVSGVGSLDDLAAAAPDEDAIAHFKRAITGEATEAVTQAIVLNAAAMTMAGRHESSWPNAVRHADKVVRSGDAIDVIERCRNYTPTQET